jgi:hypothetical protein
VGLRSGLDTEARGKTLCFCQESSTHYIEEISDHREVNIKRTSLRTVIFIEITYSVFYKLCLTFNIRPVV